MIVTLPISNEQVDVSQAKPDILKRTSETLISGAETNKPKLYKATNAFLSDIPNVSKYTIKDIEYLVLVRMALTNIDTVLRTNDICSKCKHINNGLTLDIQDIPTGSDVTEKTLERMTIEELRNAYPKIKLESIESYENRIENLYNKGITFIKTNMDNLFIKSMSFKLPTLDELMKSEELVKKEDKFLGNILLHSLTNIQYEYEGKAQIEEWEDVVKRFGDQLFDFSNDAYMTKVKSMWNDVGLITKIEFECVNCGNSCNSTFDFLSFFAFGILQKNKEG